MHSAGAGVHGCISVLGPPMPRPAITMQRWGAAAVVQPSLESYSAPALPCCAPYRDPNPPDGGSAPSPFDYLSALMQPWCIANWGGGGRSVPNSTDLCW